MAHDNPLLLLHEAWPATTGTYAKAKSILVGRSPDFSHAYVYAAALGRPDLARTLSVEALRSLYQVLFDIAAKVYA